MKQIIFAKQFAVSKINKPNMSNKPNINISTNKLINIINSGPYDYKLFFEGKSYPHSVNLTKLVFKFKINNEEIIRIIYLSTGHSFAEIKYVSDINIQINRTSNMANIFTTFNENIFYSVDNDFNDFALLYFGNLNIDNSNYLYFNKSKYLINSICKNINIKILENEILIKNGHNTGESFAKPIINFETDTFIITKKNNYTYFTFKINGQIIIISSKYASGIIVKGIDNNISKIDGKVINTKKINEQLEYYFNSILREFRYHELLVNYNLDPMIKSCYQYYKDNNLLSVVSMMGDSGSGFFKISNNNNLEFVGININSCSILVLSEKQNTNTNNKLVLGKYVIEEVHKGSQILPINLIEKMIINKLPQNIQLIEITV